MNSKSKTHYIISNFPKPKPGPAAINSMISNYYKNQTLEYDSNIQDSDNKRLYNDSINELISNDLKLKQNTSNVLHIGCATGTRALRIRKLSEIDYNITGVDVCKAMCNEAKSKGINVIAANWLSSKLNKELKFDAISWVYSFGHISTNDLRIKALRKVRRHLKKGASLYIEFFNLENKNEWGPEVSKLFRINQLEKYGYEEGDVFYKQKGNDELSFYHYFSLTEIKELLTDTGFKIDKCFRIGYNIEPGNIINESNEGFYFVIAS